MITFWNSLTIKFTLENNAKSKRFSSDSVGLKFTDSLMLITWLRSEKKIGGMTFNHWNHLYYDKKIFLRLFKFISDYQLYLPAERDEAFEGARSSLRIKSGPRNAICFWFKSVNHKGGEILRLSQANDEKTFLTLSSKGNNVIYL